MNVFGLAGGDDAGSGGGHLAQGQQLLLQQCLILGDLDHHQRGGIGQGGKCILQVDGMGIQAVLGQIGQGGPLADMRVGHADGSMAVQIGSQRAEAVIHDDDRAVALERIFGQGVDQVLVCGVPGLQRILELAWIAIQGQATMGRVEKGLHRRSVQLIHVTGADGAQSGAILAGAENFTSPGRCGRTGKACHFPVLGDFVIRLTLATMAGHPLWEFCS